MGHFPLMNTSMSPRRYSAKGRVCSSKPTPFNFGPQSYTITNVTLKTGTGYAVEFLNPTNYSDVYAISPRFEVKVAGSEFFRRWSV